MQHLLSSQDLSREQILALLSRAAEFLPIVRERKRLPLAEGKILATLFYEASTRTRFSFETAMLRLGGHVISNADMTSTSSAKKGESLYDTGKMISTFADVIAMRHPTKGSVAELAKGSSVPVINGGDGAGDHPTQGLLDIFTIQKALGRLDTFTIAMVGDLKNSRVVHSQCEYLLHFEGVKFILVSPEALKMPAELVEKLKTKGFEVTETEDLEAAIAICDVLSDTRIQQERFESEAEYQKYNGIYVLTPALMAKAKKDMIVIDPLPRVNHIDPAVDSDPRAKYFEQVENGVAVRMALLAHFLGL
ncbi:aspartate carbamoyltransferase [Candidatus Peregrinibacteria bacterium]|nr:MAG: aspartate carbamoyltransferase [Candidatus Peregrinibacteria bacterium]